MKLKKMKIEELNAAEYNPRREMTPQEYADLRRSIDENGYLEPIVVNIKNKRNVVVSGHQRLRVMRDMRIDTVTVSTVSLNDEQEQELNVILNRVKGHWDAQKLANLVASVENKKHLGFSQDEIDLLLKASDEKLKHIFDNAQPLKEQEEECTCPCCGKKGPEKVFGSWH